MSMNLPALVHSLLWHRPGRPLFTPDKSGSYRINLKKIN